MVYLLPPPNSTLRLVGLDILDVLFSSCLRAFAFAVPSAWEDAFPTPCMQWPLASFRTCLKCCLSKAHPSPCPPSCSISLSCLMFLYFIYSYLELYYIFIMLVFIIYLSMRPGLLSPLISVKLLSRHSINIYWPKELGLPGFCLNFILSKIPNFV